MQNDRYYEERLTDGARFVLPARHIAQGSRWGWAVCGIASLGLALMICWMAIPIAAGVAVLPRDPMFFICSCGFACLGIVGLMQLSKLFCLGLAIVLNRTFTEVVLRDRRLLCHERFFAFRYVRRCQMPVNELRQLTIQLARLPSSQVTSHQLKSWLGDARGLLSARGGDKTNRAFTIAAAYPVAVLQRLAMDLQSSMRHLSIEIEPESSDEAHSMGIDETNDEPAMARPPVAEQPPGSDATIERRSDGIALFIPPAGIVRGSKGLFVFTIVWNILIGGFLTMLTLSVLGIFKVPIPSLWFGYLFLLPFSAVGMGSLLAAINMGLRTTAIATSGDKLFVVRKGLFGKKTQQWRLSEVAIRVAHSGMKVNNQPLLELQIHGINGKFGILCERPEIELHWIAGQLRELQTQPDCPAESIIVDA